MEQTTDLVNEQTLGEKLLEQTNGLDYLVLDQLTVESEELAPAIQQIINIALTVPLIHPSKFAEHVGRSTGVIGGWLDAGYLPTVKVGRYQMINLALLTENLKKGFLL